MHKISAKFINQLRQYCKNLERSAVVLNLNTINLTDDFNFILFCSISLYAKFNSLKNHWAVIFEFKMVVYNVWIYYRQFYFDYTNVSYNFELLKIYILDFIGKNLPQLNPRTICRHKYHVWYKTTDKIYSRIRIAAHFTPPVLGVVVSAAAIANFS